MKNLGQRIRELREEKDISLRQLAKKLGLSASFLSDVELGRRFPSKKVWPTLRKVIDKRISPQELMKLVGEEPGTKRNKVKEDKWMEGPEVKPLTVGKIEQLTENKAGAPYQRTERVASQQTQSDEVGWSIANLVNGLMELEQVADLYKASIDKVQKQVASLVKKLKIG